MPLSSSQLEAFVAVAQTLNFTRAAERLHVTQSALSQRILNLEAHLEVSLFIRDRAGLKLTDVAVELLRYCQIKDHLEDDFVSKIQSQDSKALAGTVRIGAFSSVMRSVIVPTLADLFSAHPKLKLNLLTREVPDLLALLRQGEVDYVVLPQKLDREELTRISLGVEKNVLVQKKGYSGPDVYLDHDEQDKVTLDYLKFAKKKTATVERRYLDDVYGLIDGARNGMGRAVLPTHLIKGDKAFEVIDPSIVLEIPVYLYFYTQPYYSRLHTEVVSELKEKAKRYLP